MSTWGNNIDFLLMQNVNANWINPSFYAIFDTIILRYPCNKMALFILCMYTVNKIQPLHCPTSYISREGTDPNQSGGCNQLPVLCFKWPKWKVGRVSLCFQCENFSPYTSKSDHASHGCSGHWVFHGSLHPTSHASPSHCLPEPFVETPQLSGSSSPVALSSSILG